LRGHANTPKHELAQRRAALEGKRLREEPLTAQMFEHVVLRYIEQRDLAITATGLHMPLKERRRHGLSLIS